MVKKTILKKKSLDKLLLLNIPFQSMLVRCSLNWFPAVLLGFAPSLFILFTV